MNSKSDDTASSKKDPVITVYDSIYIIALIFTFALLVIAIITDKNVPKTDAEVFSEIWYYDTALTQPADLKHPNERKEYKAGSAIHYYTRVPSSSANGDGIMFKAKNCSVSVYVGNESQPRTGYESHGNIYGKTSGTGWLEFPVFEEDAGELIHIEFIPCYNDSSCYLGPFFIGNCSDVVTSTIAGHFPAAIVGILIFFVGVILLAIFFALKRATRINEMDLLYLGLISIVFSSWTFTETKIMQFFTHNTGAVHNFSCMMLTLIPLPVLLLFHKPDSKKSTILNKVVAGITILNVIATFILHFGGIADFHETLRLTHITLILSAITAFFTNIYYCLHMKKPERRDIVATFGIIIISVFGVIDIIRYKNGGTNDSSQFARIAILVYILSLGLANLEHAVSMIKKGMTADFVSRLAYEDGLTGLGNRTAYNEMLASIAENNREHSVFMFDVNHLKYVNDNLGHAAGDNLITAAANIIQENFGNIGKCYRIGGDEFVCISDQGHDTDKVLSDFFEAISKYNTEYIQDFPLIIAAGGCMCNKNEDIYHAVAVADKNMYDCKTELKKNHPLEKLLGSL